MNARDRAWRRGRLHAARLYLCCGVGAGGGDLRGFLDAVLAGGVDIVQLRDKAATREEQAAAAAVFCDAARRHGALFVVNDDPGLAAEVGADGVHVGQDDAPPEVARAVVGEEALIGLSTHGREQFDRAQRADADYCGLGPVHATPTKEGRPGIGLEPLRRAAERPDAVPWFVTGGMAPETVGDVIAVGARRIVVVRALTDAADPGRAARRLCALLDSAPGGPVRPRGNWA